MENKLQNYKNFFKWDYYARHDQKVSKLIRLEGYEGYGLFVGICELLHEYNGKSDLETIKYELRFSEPILNRVLDDYDLFILKDGVYSNKRINEQIEDRIEKSIKAKKSANSRWNK